MSRVETPSRLHRSRSGAAARRAWRHRHFVGAPIGSRRGSGASSGNLAARMMFAFAFAFAAAVLLGGVPVQAQQFSAELIASNAAGGTVGSPGKIFVADRKVRIETADFPNDFLLVDGNVPAAYLVRQRLRVFMDAKQSSRLTRLFGQQGGLDPCAQWRTMGGSRRYSSRRRQPVALRGDRGRNPRWPRRQHEIPHNVTQRPSHCVDRRASSIFPSNSKSTMGPYWHCAIFRRARSHQGAFEVPGNFKKFDQQLFLERLKHTDIWVDP